MSSDLAFFYGDGVIVTAYGPGKLYLLSYASNQKILNHVGAISTKSGTTDKDITRFIVAHSYSFDKYAFYWEGGEDCVCGIGKNFVTVPVGTSWDKATTIAWGGNEFGTDDVWDEVEEAVSRDNQVTCFVIPDSLL